MKKSNLFYCVTTAVALLVVGNSAQAGEWRFPVGLTYASGFSDVADLFEKNMSATGFAVSDSSSWPVGIAFQPYYQFDGGMGIGGGFGPAMLIYGDSYDMYAVPINLSARYTFAPDSNISPYLRAGVSYFIANGDFVKGSDAGISGGAGIEFGRRGAVGFGIEMSYDAATITMDKISGPFFPFFFLYGYPMFSPPGTEEIKPGGFMVSIYAVF